MLTRLPPDRRAPAAVARLLTLATRDRRAAEIYRALDIDIDFELIT